MRLTELQMPLSASIPRPGPARTERPKAPEPPVRILAIETSCDETAAGRHLNRRVELWLVPDFDTTVTDSPESGN